MTEENYNYRTSQTLLRNQFSGNGKLKIPMIPKFQEKPGDFDDLLLIGFDKTHLEDQNHLDRMVHFFLYDYRFERVWKHPDNDVEKLSRYRAVLSPDFSMYLEMAPVMQIYNVFRNRWCGAYWASKGIRVIPAVNWGDESTFDFCFEGIEKGSVVAVSTYMATEHDNCCDQKEWFIAGYDEMLRRIEPEKIICYNTPFPEMQGNIIYVDYERSFRGEDLDAFKIGSTSSGDRDTIEPYLIGKGGGSAYGADWKPNPKKPNDWKFLGNPGDINQTYNKHGELYETHIGPDGKADYEIHHSDHGNPGEHVNPHAHEIIWTPTGPSFNPMDMPLKRFIQRKEIVSMTPLIPANTPEQNQFVSISDFKWCVDKGGEIDFIWDGKEYGISHSRGRIIAYLWGQPDTTQYFATADDVLNYMVGSDRLRDVITQVTVLDRTI